MPVQVARVRSAKASRMEAFLFVLMWVLMLALGWPYLFSAQDTLLVLCGFLTFVPMVLWTMSMIRRVPFQLEK